MVIGSRMMLAGRRAPAACRATSTSATGSSPRVAEQRQPGCTLSEWHSGYRAFSTAALAGIPFTACSDGFDFDTEVLLQLHDVGAASSRCRSPPTTATRSATSPESRTPATWWSTSCATGSSGWGSGRDAGLRRAHLRDEGRPGGRATPVSSTGCARRPPGRVLDLGCGEGYLGERLRSAGHEVTGVDVRHLGGGEGALDHVVRGGPRRGPPGRDPGGEPFDMVLAADVLEHVRRPKRLLAELARRAARRAAACSSSSRTSGTGTRGSHDSGASATTGAGSSTRTTCASSRAGASSGCCTAGWHVMEREATGLPFDVADRGGSPGGRGPTPPPDRPARRSRVRARPTLFGYQLLYELEPARRPAAR